MSWTLNRLELECSSKRGMFRVLVILFARLDQLLYLGGKWLRVLVLLNKILNCGKRLFVACN
jgi:hypothetical protein